MTRSGAGRCSCPPPTGPSSRSTSPIVSSTRESRSRRSRTQPPKERTSMATVSVRYIVDDVDAAIAFYCEHLGFEEKMHPAPTFAMLTRGDLRLVLSAPSGAGGGGQAMPDGTSPAPGGWNRFMVEVEDLDDDGRGAPRCRRPVSQRHRHRRRRQADPGRRPERQPNRTVRADPAGGIAVGRRGLTVGADRAARAPCARHRDRRAA